MDKGLTSNIVNTISSTSTTITLHIPFDAHRLLTIHHEMDEQNLIHTHFAMQNIKEDGHKSFDHGFYRHPDGSVIGPIFRD